MPYGVMLIFVIGLPMLLAAFTMFDQILEFEYRHHRSDWDKDGKPRGFLWKADECVLVMSEFAKQNVCIKWLFHTPLWARESVECNKTFKRFRLLVLGWNILAAILGISIMWGGPVARQFMFGSLMR